MAHMLILLPAWRLRHLVLRRDSNAPRGAAAPPRRGHLRIGGGASIVQPPWAPLRAMSRGAPAAGGVAVANLAPGLSREDVMFLFDRYGEVCAPSPHQRIAAGAGDGPAPQVTHFVPRPDCAELWYADAADADHVARVLDGTSHDAATMIAV